MSLRMILMDWRLRAGWFALISSVLGSVLGILHIVPFLYRSLFVIMACLLLIMILAWKSGWMNSLPWLALAFLSLFFFSAGDWRAEQVYLRFPTTLYGEKISFLATVHQLEVKRNWEIIHLIVTNISNSNRVQRAYFQAVWIPNREDRQPYQIGEQLQLEGTCFPDRISSKVKSTFPSNVLVQFLYPQYELQATLVQSLSMNPKRNLGVSILQKLQSLFYNNSPTAMRPQARILLAMLVGSQNLSKSEKNIFLTAGIPHVISANGMNVKFLVQVLSLLEKWLLRFILVPVSIRIIALLCSVWIYTIICGSTASMVRYSLMETYRLSGVWVHRQPSSTVSFVLSSCFLIWICPSVAFSSSSLLSFAASYGIQKAVLFFPKRYSKKRIGRFRIMHYIYCSFLLDLFAELYIDPLCLELFGQWTPYALLSNLLLVPVLLWFLPVLYAWIGVCLLASIMPFFHSVAYGMGCILTKGTQKILQVISVFGNAPHAMMQLPSWPFYDLCAYYLALEWLFIILRKIFLSPR